MLERIKSMDIFGSKFAFTIGKSQKFKTTFGALLSFICIILTGLFTYFFGSDFFKRTNPRVLMKTVIPVDYFKVNLTHTNFLIPWLIDDKNSIIQNSTGIFYPVWTYQQYHLNERNERVNTLTRTIGQKKCESKYQYLVSGINITDYYCPDWEEFQYELGGYSDGPFMYKIQMQMHYCPNGTNYSPKNNCTSLDKLDSIFNIANNWYINFLYPQYLFTPENLESPFTIIYKDYHFALSVGLTKTDRFYFQRPVLMDDQGWIMKSNTTTETLSLLFQQSDFALFPRDKYYQTGQSSMFYRMVIYLDKTHNGINRSFMKFQELAAIVGGFMKVITSVCWITSQIYNSYKKNQFLINQIFDFTSEKDYLISEKKPTENKVIESISNFGNSKSKIEKENLQNNFLKLENKSQSNLGNEKINIKNYLEKYKFPDNNNFKNYEFGLFFTLRTMFCKFGNNMKERRNLYLLTNNFLDQKLDISFYLENLIIFERMRTMIFNHQQNLSMKFLRKFNPNLIEDQKFIKEESPEERKDILREILEYYPKLIRENRLSAIDKNIMEGLEKNLRDILEKIAKN